MTQENSVVFKKARAEHVSSMHEIEKQVFPTPWSHESLMQDVCGHEIAFYIVGLINEEVVSYAGFWFVLNEAHITNIAVRPGYRRMGIARSMMNILLDEAVQRGIDSISLEVRESNEAAQRLYEGIGFVKVGRRKGYYTDTGEDALLMTLMLNNG